jgi:hypothetical protein
MGLAGSARDYLNAPIDTWLTFYNFGYSTLVTPEDGMDVTSSVTSNVLSQSIVVTRTMDYGVALLRLGVGMGLSVWGGGDVILNYERVVAKPAGQPDAQAIRTTIRQVR